MFIKVLAVVALVALPLNVVLWRRSHVEPNRYRWDLTLYKSLDVYLKDGVCGLHVLSMPTKVASRTEFETAISYDPVPNQASFLLSSKKRGPYRYTWIVFPFWFPFLLLSICGMLPLVRGPVRRWIRRKRGLCVECGYDLRGSRSGRCSECGTRYRK